MGRDGYLQSMGDTHGGGLWCQSNPLSCSKGGFGFDFFRLLRGQHGYIGSGGMMMTFRWGGAEDMDECDIAPLRSLYKHSASNPATTSCTFCNPSASNCCASSHGTLAPS